jgi:hypothetical protein
MDPFIASCSTVDPGTKHRDVCRSGTKRERHGVDIAAAGHPLPEAVPRCKQAVASPIQEGNVKYRKLAATALVLSFLAPCLCAQTAAVDSAPAAANAVDPASIKALKDMGAHLQTLKRFQVSTELTAERVLVDGQKLQHSATATLDVERPNRLRARIASARAEREIVYDGKAVTLSNLAQKYHATVPFTDTIGALIIALEDRYGVEMPLYDLFLWGTPAAPLDKIDSAMNAGQDFIGDDLCDQYAFRQGDFDWQIWITTGSNPLPRKLVITSRYDEARPQSVSVLDWNLEPSFEDAVFRFTPPEGSTAVELRSLDKK